MHSMSAKHLFFVATVVVCLLATGCTSPAPATPAATPTPEVTLTTPPVTVSSAPPGYVTGMHRGSRSRATTRSGYRTVRSQHPPFPGPPCTRPDPCVYREHHAGRPILGTYIFDPGQFKATEVERMEFFSSLSSPDFLLCCPPRYFTGHPVDVQGRRRPVVLPEHHQQQ